MGILSLGLTGTLVLLVILHPVVFLAEPGIIEAVLYLVRIVFKNLLDLFLP